MSVEWQKAKTKTEKVKGVGGAFTYAGVGEPLFGEYKDLAQSCLIMKTSPSTSSTPKRAASFPARRSETIPRGTRRPGASASTLAGLTTYFTNRTNAKTAAWTASF